jgi:hypothetical protein
MTIGFMLTFFDFRNDVRSLIYEICKNHKVVLFIKPEHESLVQPYLNEHLSYRIINELTPSRKNKLNTILYHILRKLPKSKNNYFLMEAFKIGGLKNKKQQKRAKLLLQLQHILPHFISYDYYLNKIDFSCKTDISGIDKMIAFTEIYDDFFLARLIKESVKTYVYVYSWDHACKHTRFSTSVNYLVWHKGIADDLIELQNIPSSQIKAFGSTQLGYIDRFKASMSKTTSEAPYFFYACGIGIQSLVHEEVNLIVQLSKSITKIYPTYKLIVRPYPNQQDWTVYDELSLLPNIVFDNNYRQQDLSVSDREIQKKFELISNAVAFFHLGTTLGLEASFTSCPVFQLDILEKNSNQVNVYNFVHQYQNEKYLINQSAINTIKTINQLEETLLNIEDSKYLQFNSKVTALFPVYSFEELANKIIADI